QRSTVTYYLDYDVITGSPAVKEGKRVLRDASPGPKDGRLGFLVQPRPTQGFVHYWPATFAAQAKVLAEYLRPNTTLLLDIVLSPVVREGAFTLTRDLQPKDFTDEPFGNALP